MTWALCSLYRPSAKSALIHHRRRLAVVWPAAIVRPPGAGVAPPSASPLPVYTSRRQRRLVHRTPLVMVVYFAMLIRQALES